MSATADDLLNGLRRRGYRITTPRRRVLDVLLARRESHLSCEEVTQALAAQGADMNATTVYRILQWLKDAGFVTQTDLGGGHDVYSWLGETPHHHLVCLNCRHIIDADDSLLEPLRRALRERHGFHARIEHFAIFGLCADCAREAATDD